jgi:hypothetical protein
MIVSTSQTPSPPDPPEWFWAAIEYANGSPSRFQTALSALTRDQLIQAYAYFRDLARIFTAEKYVKHMDPDISEDGSFDVGAWIVTKGRDYFRQTYADPSKVPATDPPGTEEEQQLMGEIIREYLRRYDDDMPTNRAPEYPGRTQVHEGSGPSSQTGDGS